MICSQCNKEFVKTHHSQKYCSQECLKINKHEYQKKYRQTDKRKESNLKYSRSDKGKAVNKKIYETGNGKASQRKYQQSDKGRAIRSKRLAEKRKTDPMYKIIDTIKSRLNKYLKASNIDKVNKTFDMVGCTPEFLKQYLEKKFKPGMTWKNHTKKGWHIDHIIPISKAETLEDINRLTHYTNLQPMWAIDNLKKGNKVIF